MVGSALAGFTAEREVAEVAEHAAVHPAQALQADRLCLVVRTDHRRIVM